MEIILASASPRRKELMKLITPQFTVCTAEIDEALFDAATPTKLVADLAKAKCQAVAQMYPNACVIGCDTVVNAGGKVLGKPQNKTQAKQMLSILSGTKHFVHTGVYIYTPQDCDDFVATSEVWVSPLTDDEIDEYINTDEPYDKAGGYGIQGWAAKHISRIEGCYYNIVGLPVSQLYANLHSMCII